jgi:tRNA(Ile)-lysidine synthetase-like protein
VSTADGPVTDAEADALFADFAAEPVLVLAVSGGPDSTALMLLAARWRARHQAAPQLRAVTVDHGLRPQSRHEAAAVKRLAASLGVTHRTMRWPGAKPITALQEKARAARYRLLHAAARAARARFVLTAHTLDDQAETVLFRLARGSGLAGLAGMARLVPLTQLIAPTSQVKLSAEAGGLAADADGFFNAPANPHGDPINPHGEERPRGRVSNHASAAHSILRDASLRDAPQDEDKGAEHDENGAWHATRSGGGRAGPKKEVWLARPFLVLPKLRLNTTLSDAGIAYAADPSNDDPRFARTRMRRLMPALAVEGLTPRRLALLARRARRSEAALEAVLENTAARLGLHRGIASIAFDAQDLCEMPAEIVLRILGRAIDILGDEGPVELAKLETLSADLDQAMRGTGMRFRRTLAGAMVSLQRRRIIIVRAPPRRRPRGRTPEMRASGARGLPG